MRRVTLALLLMVSACAGSTSTEIPNTAPSGYTLAGPWTLHLVASESCSGLPADAKSRSYDVSIYQTGYDTISMNAFVNRALTPIMAASYAGLKINDKLRIVDDSVAGGLVIDGIFTGRVSSSKIPGTLNGHVTTPTVDCVATDHTANFIR
jgi:hypothetical protein